MNREQSGARVASQGPSVAPRNSNYASARLLDDLVANTLDPGYAAAAKRQGGSRRSGSDRALVAIGALLVGFLLVVAYVHTNRGAPAAKQVHDRLVQRVREARDNADRLAADLARDEASLSAAQASALPAAGGLAQSVAKGQLLAGQVAATGPGLVVTLTDPRASSASSAVDGRGGSVPISTTPILTDRDIRAVVNELWHDGAEAIAVNDVRLTPTSAIRFAGEAILVDFRPLTSPYRIRAIGSADHLATEFAQSAAASKYQTLAGASGIGFRFDNESRVDLPANSAMSLRYASPAPTGSPAAPKTKHQR